MLSLLAGLAVATSGSTAQGTVVMIHGAGGGGWEYDLWKPVFEKAGWKVVNKDLVPVNGDYAKTEFEDYLRQVLTWTPKSGRVVLVGASMGGILAIKAAEIERVDAVVLVNSTTPKGVGPARNPGAPVPPIMRWANGPLKDTEDAMPDSDRKTILWAWKRWRDESGAVMNSIRSGINAHPPKCPTLCVLATADTDVPFARGVALADWAKADVFTYRGMSHVGPLMSTRATEVAQSVLHWLAARKK